MFTNISNRFYGWAKGWLVLVLFVLDGFFAGFLLPLIQGMMQGGQGGITPLDLMMFQTPDKLFAMLAKMGDLTFYRNVELTVDIIYPIIYLFFFGLAISWLFQRGFSTSSPMRKLNVTPLGAWLFDLLENIAIVVLIAVFPATPPALGWLLFIFSSAKWLFVFATVFLLLTGLVMALKNGFKKQD